MQTARNYLFTGTELYPFEVTIGRNAIFFKFGVK